MFLQVLLVTTVFLLISFLALGVRVFFSKNGRFPNTSVGGNKHLAKMGIYCAKCEEMKKFREIKKRKISGNELKISL